MKDLSDLILQEHGKTICEKNKEITSFRMGAYRSIEKAAQGNYQSWMLDTMVAVDKAMKIAVSQKEFIAVMSGMGYTCLLYTSYHFSVAQYRNFIRDFKDFIHPV